MRWGARSDRGTGKEAQTISFLKHVTAFNAA